MQRNRNEISRFIRLTWLLYGAMAVVVLIIAEIVITDYRTDKAVENMIREEINNHDLRVNLIHLNEVLTMSAQMAIVSVDPVWRDRHRNNVPILQRSLKRATVLYTNKEAQAAIELAQRASYSLIALEEKALELAWQNKQQAARNILNGEKYLALKRAYLKNTNTFVSSSALYAEAVLDDTREEIEQRLLLVIPTVAFIILCVFVVIQARRVIARQLQIEEELTGHRNNLQKLVDQKTQSLRLAKNEAERANHLKSEFLANVTHELKTPVHCIMNYAQIGLDDYENDDRDALKERLEDIYGNSHRLNILISDLLDLSKIESGTLVLNMENHRLHAMLTRAIEMTHGLLEKKDLQVDISAVSESDIVHVDARRFEQVLINLLSNAARFSPEKGRISWASCHGSLSGKDSDRPVPAVVLTVRDDGPGVREEELENIFDPFIQGREALVSGGGTGLGLALCRSFLTKFNGKIHAKNTGGEGSGTVFEICLPLH